MICTTWIYDRFSVSFAGRESAEDDRCSLCERPLRAGEQVWGISLGAADEFYLGWGQVCESCRQRVLRDGIPVGAATGQG